MKPQKHIAFDVFLSRKTEDIPLALQVYERLTAAGYSVFDASISLPEMGIADYSKAIDLALDNARHLIVVASTAEHPASSWVEAEWRFFLNKKRAGKAVGNLLCVVDPGVHIHDLPPSLQNFEVIPTTDLDRLFYYVNSGKEQRQEVFAATAPPPPPPPQTEPPRVSILSTVFNSPYLRYGGIGLLAVALLVFGISAVTRAGGQDRERGAELFQEAYRTSKNNETREAYLLYKESAELGYAPAYQALSTIHLEGIGVTKDTEAGLEYAKQALDLGYEVGAFNIGWDYQMGRSGRVDTVLAEEYFNRALPQVRQLALEGDAECQNLYGLYHDMGLGPVTKNEETAADYFMRAANQGHPGATVNIGNCFLYGKGLPADHSRALDWYRKGEKLGYSRSIYGLGYMYDHGLGVPESDSIASVYFTKSAELGNTTAYHALGLQYQNGTGVPQSDEKAMWWFRRGSEKGNAFCMFSLGRIYHNGIGVPRDYEEAQKWYLKAADLNNADAMVNLGILYNSADIFDDNNKAVGYFERAAALGNEYGIYYLAYYYHSDLGGLRWNGSDAMYWYKKAFPFARKFKGNFIPLRIAELYDKGSRYVTANVKNAVHWHEISAHEGNAYSMTRMGDYHRHGIEVIKSDAKADRWRRLAERDNAKRMHLGLTNKDGTTQKYYVYLLDEYETGSTPTDWEERFFHQQYGVTIPEAITEAFDRLWEISQENEVSFVELAEYALDNSNKE